MAARLGDAEQQERNFLMSVSHELRTPLTAIRGHVEALREGIAADPDVRAASLDMIASETARLERLVGDVLDLAKLEAHRFTLLTEEVDMERLCEQAYAAFGEEARRRGIDYEKRFDARPDDRDRTATACCRSSRTCSRTRFAGRRTAARSSSSSPRRTAASRSRSTTAGPGVPPEERDRIFRPFWSRDDSGTGLGLAIAHELAAALGGSDRARVAAGQRQPFRARPAGGVATSLRGA